jgi:DNA recombination protein Rad52
MFSEPQVKALSSKLSAKHVRTRQHSGLTLSYIEGWHTIAEANRIFGYDAWDRQTMAVKCVWEGMKGNRSACSYIARVRVRVRAGDAEICREGCGSGHGVGLTPGEAHESAIKEAETDAMKRALSTFGNPFGLALYDKEQQNVRGRRKKQPRSAPNGKDRPITWLMLSSEGEYISAHEDPVDYCKAMRQLLEAISTRQRLRDFWQRNLVTLAMLRRNLPDLKTGKGEHYAEILTSLYKQQMRVVWEEAKTDARRTRELAGRSEAREVRDQGPRGPQENGQLSSAPEKAPEGLNDRVPETKHFQPSERQGASGAELVRQSHRNGVLLEASPAIGADVSPKGGAKILAKEDDANGAPGHIDKSKLPISAPRRIRDKEHLRYVASQPCIICGRSPGHAHHLRFAQPRALGRKVSDEWTVPLCSTHHRALHSVGDEKQWWREKGIDPIAHAVRLWWDTRHGGVEHLSQMAEAGSGIVFAGRNGSPAAGKQIGPSAQTTRRMKGGVISVPPTVR